MSEIVTDQFVEEMRLFINEIEPRIEEFFKIGNLSNLKISIDVSNLSSTKISTKVTLHRHEENYFYVENGKYINE